MLTHLVGTPWMPNITNGILFVEDVNEHPYRIERMLLQLRDAGILEKQQALVLGHFTQFNISDYDNGYDFDAMLAWVRQTVSIPVLTGLPFGHIKDKISLPIGAWGHLQSTSGNVSLTLSHYPFI